MPEKYEKTLYEDDSVKIVGIYKNPEHTDLITIEHRYKNSQEEHRTLTEENGTLKTGNEMEDRMSYANR